MGGPTMVYAPTDRINYFSITIFYLVIFIFHKIEISMW
jgi:hypothetical protein